MPDQNLPCDRLPALDPPIDLPTGGHPGARPAVAVIVFHGMGQQVKFQTLNDVAYGIRDAAIRAGTILAQPRTVLLRQCKSDGECRYIPRAELEIAETPGTVIHVYECYWAPLTEGKVTLRDVARFLTKAGIDRFRPGTRRFYRILFGDWKPVSRARVGVCACNYRLWRRRTIPAGLVPSVRSERGSTRPAVLRRHGACVGREPN